MFLCSDFTAPRQPASISTYALPTPSPSPPWDRGLTQHTYITSSPPPPAASSPLLTSSTVTMAQLVNQQMIIMPTGGNPNGKDSRWLTLEVCREYQRSKCSRSDNECKFAHPPAHVEVQNGRVVACFDSIKGKCQRKDPPCKYLHPPQHLREQLLQNGRNNLILKNLQLQAYQQAQYGVLPVAGPKTVAVPAVLPGQYSYLTHYPGLQTISAVPAQASATSYNPFIATSLASVAMQTSADGTMSQALPPNLIPTTTKAIRADKFETTSENGESVTSHAPLVDTYSFPTYIPQPTSAATLPHQLVLAKKRARDPTDDLLLQSAIPGMMPAYKRIAIGDMNKGGIPVYQSSQLMAPLQHTSLLQLQQPSYIPMSYTYVYPSDAGLSHMTPAMFAPPLTSLSPTLVPSTSPTVAPAVSSTVSTVSSQSSTLSSLPATSGLARLPTTPHNAYSVEYFGNNKQLLDTLPVCQDFKSGQCSSPYCKQVHLSEDYVEVNNGQVTVCRDYATRQTCKRSRCKYYHIPVELPPS